MSSRNKSSRLCAAVHPRSRSTEDGDFRLDDVLFRCGVRNVVVSSCDVLCEDFRCFIGVEGAEPEGSACSSPCSCLGKRCGQHSSSYFLGILWSSLTSRLPINLGAMKRTVEPEPFVLNAVGEERDNYYY